MKQFRDCGCVYVAFGFEYLMLAAHSARTLKQNNPGLATTLVTNVPTQKLVADGVEVFDQVIYRDLPSNMNRRDKLSVDAISPYYKTVYLDCDTEVWGDLSPMFSMLDDYDLAVRIQNRSTSSEFEISPGISAASRHLSEWNAGVIFFRKSDRAAEVFRRWRDIYNREGMTRDQPAFMRAILETRGLLMFPLSPLWNAKPGWLEEFNLIEHARGQVRIVHYREPLRRPGIAKAIYQTFRALEVTLDFARCTDEERAKQLSQDKTRFDVLYYYYSQMLKPFDNRFGRRMLLIRNGRPIKRLLGVFLYLRGVLTRDAAFQAGRDRQVVGQLFRRAETNAGER